MVPHLPERPRPLLFGFKSTFGYVPPARMSQLGLPGPEYWQPAITDHYRFALTRPEMDGLLIGLRKPDQVTALEEALARGPLTEEEEEYLMGVASVARGEVQVPIATPLRGSGTCFTTRFEELDHGPERPDGRPAPTATNNFRPEAFHIEGSRSASHPAGKRHAKSCGSISSKGRHRPSSRLLPTRRGDDPESIAASTLLWGSLKHGSKNEATPPEQPRPSDQPPIPKRRFHLLKLEERIAPRKGGNGTNNCCGVGSNITVVSTISTPY
jgi:hypothetical protein